MSARNSRMECPNCEDTTLQAMRPGSEQLEVGLVIHRYICADCRRTYTSVESLFEDDEGDPDSFLNLALNARLRDRENRYRRLGTKPRRQLKPVDHLAVHRKPGLVSIRYVPSPHVKALFLTCKNGHDLNEVGIYLKSDGARVCLPCKRKYQREWDQQRRRKSGSRREVAA